MKLTTNFSLEELTVTTNEKWKAKNLKEGLLLVDRLTSFASTILEKIRTFYNTKTTVNSCFRCSEISSSSSSQHNFGEAADITQEGKTPKELFIDLFNKTVPLSYDFVSQIILEESISNPGHWGWVHIAERTPRFIQYRKEQGRSAGLEYLCKLKNSDSYIVINSLDDIPKNVA